MSLDAVEYLGVPTPLRAVQRLVVAWQHPTTRRISPVGFLDCDDDETYRFRYLRSAAVVEGFAPFVGFPALATNYESRRLFPIFATRVMSYKRPDFGAYLDALHLGPDATPWEQMARSEGRRTGDTIQVLRVPEVGVGGETDYQFLVHGIRHVVGDVLPHLSPGDALRLIPEPGNPVNVKALLLATGSGAVFGYVPDLLLDYVESVVSVGGARLSVEHVNGLEAPPHLRVLARISGRVPAGSEPMTGPGWETFV